MLELGDAELQLVVGSRATRPSSSKSDCRLAPARSVSRIASPRQRSVAPRSSRAPRRGGRRRGRRDRRASWSARSPVSAAAPTPGAGARAARSRSRGRCRRPSAGAAMRPRPAPLAPTVALLLLTRGRAVAGRRGAASRRRSGAGSPRGRAPRPRPGGSRRRRSPATVADALRHVAAALRRNSGSRSLKIVSSGAAMKIDE